MKSPGLAIDASQMSVSLAGSAARRRSDARSLRATSGVAAWLAVLAWPREEEEGR
jgi:hypothetical protein